MADEHPEPELKQEAAAEQPQAAAGTPPVEGAVTRIEKEAMTRERVEATQQFIFKKIDRIVFGMLSPKMIKKMASAKIVTPELYDKEGYPVDGGLMDVRLGVIDPGLRCKTCGSKLKECVGHFGYIELARPVIHIKFVNIILSILKTSCRECGRIMLPDEKAAKAMPVLKKIEKEDGPQARRLAVKTLVERLRLGGKCPHCKGKQGKVMLEKPSTYMEDERRLSPIEVRARLERIPDKDIEVYGLNPQTARPEWMILTVLPIPPVTMRPSITLETGERSEDDLTHKLGDIVRINQRLFENINAGAPEIIIEDLWDLLQYHVTTFFDNAVPKLPPARHRSGQPLKTLTERIKSKEGRIRHNLAGKRTNFCARTVISPDPMIHINAVGVPMMIAMKLSVPEVVNDWNLAYLKKFVENGPDKYPGANYLIRPDGKKKKITDETKEALLEEIQPGYVVERHLLDGDIALFNRQPSLHRMSMMCHRIKVLPGRTFRLNPAVCAPYNADFDGDEMNLHVPQSEEARAEAQILMEVSTQLISPRYGASEIGAIQDGISGNYYLTKHLTDISRELAIELLTSAGIYEFGRLPKKERLSGKDVFSALLPDDFNYLGESRSGEKVVIKDGRITEGIIDTLAIGGEGEGALLRALHKRYGPQRTIDILHHSFRLGIEVLLRTGLSVTVANSDLPPDARAEINKLMEDADKDVQGLIRQFEAGSLELIPGRSMAQTLEFKILERLNRARNSCKSIVDKHVSDKNHTALIIRSGARGNILNMVQMGAVIGQQSLRGGRIDKGYRGRTLSCFRAGDLTPAAKGFIRSSYKSGLNPKEFFFGSITGRDALMDTALRTPKSGYLYRRLANALQDIKVEYDGTVRDASGRIIQFDYGDDGIDVSRSEGGKIDVDRIIEMTE